MLKAESRQPTANYKKAKNSSTGSRDMAGKSEKSSITSLSSRKEIVYFFNAPKNLGTITGASIKKA